MNNYKLRFLPLGGVLGVTKNMYLYELYKDDILEDILIVDCGIGFPSEKDLGVDFVIPDISYLQDKVSKIRGIVLTHGHEDHISALPYHYAALGEPLIYGSKLTTAFVVNKFKEFGKPPKVVNEGPEKIGIDYKKEYSLGNFKIKFIRLAHSIPDTMHILIKTPVGAIYHGPDFKFDLTPPYGLPPDFYEIAKAGKNGVLCLLSDCLGAEREGFTLSEAIVGQTFEDEMRKTKGKFIMTTFSSNISRIRQCIDAAIKFNRKIVFLGRSMRENTTLAQSIGYLPIPRALMGKEQEVMKLPPNKVCLIVAGSQGQYTSALSKLAHRQNKFIQLKLGDKVVLSSDPIPGNENEVYALIEDLTLQGADVIYSDIQEQLHASGHGNQEDLKLLARLTNPRYFIPIGGTIRHQRQYERLMVELGYDKKNIFALAEGDTVWFSDKGAYRGESVLTKNIYVDAYGVGDVGQTILRDRKTLSSEGVVVAILLIDNMGHLTTQPKLLSKGFIFEQVNKAILDNGIKVIERATKPRGQELLNITNMKQVLIHELGEYFYKETGRKPLIAVEVIQI